MIQNMGSAIAGVILTTTVLIIFVFVIIISQAAVELGLSNGRLEGLNSRVRLISHRCFGFHSPAPLIASSTAAAAASKSKV
jgi:hypothetical protein